MSTPSIADELRAQGQWHKGTELGKLLQWAALHIESQDEALAELREAHAEEETERLRLEAAMNHARQAIEAAYHAVNQPLCPPIELARDMAGHINLMAAHGDPDYLLKNGMSARHVDLREKPPRKQTTRKATA